ncbi:basic amino acid ABC transporter substrate-binding protein [Candidatus Poribacteria bacterium]|jgi:ABC-type amino acid transport substrate-binding protein|nr:basic amino acid ABC transporter substrate-binding protein [Candidatus Poribacteria bacterium]MBT5534576.1 basic amino acid ABC transporter substrate-binding protein [Candidatus Poribacteria bacterium]MBT5713334.1 basic amino acid ABC transporter substrate-binding protein [Candidatus Poribacteria bacterium]MBT7099785.1 basic amino acid ABC transporter substrate-binding protein [Candidatus Poribacteria bacterium]MBT7804629.1 basic amino acid ABC transporter substrate-binding protein [Candidat
MRQLLVMLCLIVACGAPEAPSSRVVVVATDATYRPFEYLGDERGIVGYDIDLFRAIGKRAGFEVKFVNQPFVGALAGLETGTYEAIISAMTITAERAETFLFSDPYYDAGQIVAIRDETVDIASFEDLPGRKIGVQRGTTGAMKAKEAPGAELTEYDSIDLAFMALGNGTVDAVINDEPTSRSIAAARGGFRLVGDTLTEEQYGIAMRKDAQELAAEINAALTDLRADGTLDSLHAKWIAAPAE